MNEYFIGVRLNERDYTRLMTLCDKSRCNISNVIRSLINNSVINELPSRDYRALSRSIDKIGNNINQIAHKTNMAGKATDSQINEVLCLLKEIRMEIQNWKTNGNNKNLS